MIMRLALALGGLLILLIIFIVIKGLFTVSPFNAADYLSVAQQQQEITHILSTDLSSSSTQTGLSINNQNFAVTAQLSIASAQAQLLSYLKKNNASVKSTELSLKISSSIDSQLTNSLTTNNFNQEFDTVMQSQLQIYENSLVAAYKTTHGQKGKALLSQEYAGAQLLIKQLNLPTS